MLAAVVLSSAGCTATASPRRQGGTSPGRPLAPVTRSSGCLRRGALPDPTCTPGSVLASTTAQVCTPGYARAVRNVSLATKRAIYRAYGIRIHLPRSYEIDHLVPLELGGANEADNLWPEPASPPPGYHEKDHLENTLHERVCGGQMSLLSAQRGIAHNWVALYARLG